MRISKSVYYERGNGANAICLSIGDITLWFSYDTVIAFHDGFFSRKVRQNDWSNTTGKHLNAIDGGDKKSRISGELFEQELEKLLKAHNLEVQ